MIPGTAEENSCLSRVKLEYAWSFTDLFNKPDVSADIGSYVFPAPVNSDL